MPEPLWLPKLVELNNYGGSWNPYLEAVYGVFRHDFIERQATFRGWPVRVGRQLIDGKERTFWHMTSEGDVEVSRTPDLRRCERIGWIRQIIGHDGDEAIRTWPQSRGRNSRQVLWLYESDFAVILEQRNECWWLWTAYPTEREHTQRKLQRGYEAWLKANAAP